MKSIQQSLIAMLKEHSARKHLTVVVGMIAIAMMISVAWSLHINGITLASTDPACGLQEHAHTESCYDWVAVDGTESIDSTEGTEALEATEAVEAVDSTETADVVNSTETAGAISDETESTEAAGITGIEEETDEASANAEGTGASISASVEEETESLTEETEAGTEALMEDATEDATEGVTEEATESPQPGDIRVVDGVTYVYELVCGLEEHMHTDECYPDDEEDDTEVADAADEDEADGSSSDVVKSTTSLRSTNNTDSEEDEELVTVSSIMETASEEGSEEVTEEESEETTEESSGTTVTLTATASSSEDAYYFADTMTLADAADNQDESYIVYTIIDGGYYVISADDTLVKCKLVADTSDIASSTEGAGMYYWLDSDGNPVFKCTTTSSDDVFGDYRWTLSGTESDTDGSGSYTFYNSDNSVYITPEDAGVSETLSGTVWWTNYQRGKDYSVSTDSVLILTLDYTGTDGAFMVEIYDGTNDFYIDTGSNCDCWFTPYDSNSRTYGDAVISITSGTAAISLTSGDTYIVVVERSTVTDSSTTDTYVITYYDSEYNVLLEYTATGVTHTDNAVAARVYAQVGTYDVSATYAVSKDYAGTSNSGVEDTYTSNNSFSTTVTELTTTEKSEVATLYGDFDVSYTFTNYSYSEYTAGRYQDNFIFALNDGSGRTIYIYAYSGYSDANSKSNVVLYDGSTASSMSYTISADGINVGTQRWRAIMNAGVSVTIQVTRQQNVFSVYVYAVRIASGEIACDYTITFEDDSFGTETDLFLTGINCNMTGISISEDDTTYDIKSYDAYGITGTLSNALSVAASGDGWSATTTKDSSTVALIADSTSYASFVQSYSSSSNMTFYLAKVREYTVFFDGQNGGSDAATNGVIYYRGAGQITRTTTIDATGENYTVVVPGLTLTPYTSAYYQYKLRGWVNIYTGEYYDIATYEDTTITVSAANTVFYADWMVPDYDIGQKNENAVTVADTSNFVKSYLFDYNDILSLYSVSLGYDLDESDIDTSKGIYFVTTLLNASHSERWLVNSSTGVLTGNSNILKSSLNFAFLGAGRTGSLAYIAGRADQNVSSTISGNANEAYLGIVYDGIIGDEGDTVTTDNNTLLNVLFGMGNTLEDLTGTQTYADAVLGKTYVGEAYNLFQYDESNGYYYYDSTRNAAAYNQSAKTFYVYNYTEMTEASNKTGENYSDFLPFNYSSSSTSYDVYTVDYWFGMQTEIEFYLPNDSSTTGSGSVNQSNGNDMVFKFSGDDDVWVCVDDKLVLDLGGMHGAVYGEINFSTGEITIGQNGATRTTDSNGVIGVSGTTGVTTTTMSFGKGSHTLTVYYLERGASQSNLAIYFNITPVYTLKLAKEITNGTSNWISADAGIVFNVYTSEDMDDDSLLTTVETDGNGVLTINELVPGTTYYLVEVTAPEGYPLSYKYLTVYVDSAGNATVCVYSSSGELLDTLVCTANEDEYTYGTDETINTVIGSSDYKMFALSTDDTEDGVIALLLKDSVDAVNNYYLLGNLSVFSAENEEYASYMIVTMEYGNYYEYELPSTGSVGLFPYERAGVALVLISITGLLAIAFYDFVWVRKIRTNANRKEYKEEKAGGGKRFTRTRDRPRERSVNHGHARDRPGDR